MTCVILRQLSCSVLTMNLTEPMPQLTSAQKKCLSHKVLMYFVKQSEILGWKMLQKWKHFMVVFFFFLIEQTIQKKWQSLFGWPAQRGLCVCEAAELEKNILQGALCSFKNSSQHYWWHVSPCACWGSGAETISKIKLSFFTATCFSPKETSSYLAVTLSCDHLNENWLGIPQLNFL